MSRKKEKDFVKFEKEFAARLRKMPHQKLKALSKKINVTRRKRFSEGNHETKNELVERGFTDDELKKFLDVVKDPEDKICFILMASLGLRVGELTTLKGRDLNGDELRINSAKGSYHSVVKLPEKLLCLIPAREPHESLVNREAYTLRRRFGFYRKLSGLEDVYMYTLPCGQYQTKNRRYRLSLHSLRHYAISKAYKMTKDPDLARRLARHKHLDTTEKYLRSSRKEEVESVVADLAGGLPTEGIADKKTAKETGDVWNAPDDKKIIEDLNKQFAEAHKEYLETHKKALEVYNLSALECRNPQSFLNSIISKWLKDPRYSKQRETLAFAAWAKLKHPDKITPDFEMNDLPEVGQEVVDFYFNILEASGVKFD